jgi:histone deacetylase 1/2
MQQPPGFIHSEFSNHVCKLQKAIYGLRQAPRAWHESLKNFVISVGFSTSLSDPSLFIYNKDGVRAFLLVYVDDLLLTGNNTSFSNQFMTELSKKNISQTTWVSTLFSWHRTYSNQNWLVSVTTWLHQRPIA